jgi:hypothetical protein
MVLIAPYAAFLKRRREASRPLLTALFAVAALSLAACYASPALLFDESEAAHPLEEGLYQRADADHAQFRVSLGSDGWYRIERVEDGGLIGESHRVLLSAMTLDGGREGFAVAEQTDEGYDYAVAYLDHGRVYLATPDCVDPLDRNDAVDHGGQGEDDDPMTHNCSFKTRGALTAALAAYAGHASFGAPYIRK